MRPQWEGPDPKHSHRTGFRQDASRPNLAGRRASCAHAHGGQIKRIGAGVAGGPSPSISRDGLHRKAGPRAQSANATEETPDCASVGAKPVLLVPRLYLPVSVWQA